MKKFLVILLAAIPVLIISCSKDEGLADNPNTITLAKHWFVTVQNGTSSSPYALFSTRTFYKTETIDASGNQVQRIIADTITLDDHNLLTPTLRSHVKINVMARTFGEGQYKNWNDTLNPVIIKEGRIIKEGGRSKAGRTVDSIYIKYAFSAAPLTEYTLTGHERTGLLDDEY